MIVECPNCQAKFRLPDEKIGPQGTKLRCGKCRHVFEVNPPEEPLAGGLADFDFPDDMTAPPETPPAPKAAPAAASRDEETPSETFHSEEYETPSKPDEDADASDMDAGSTAAGFSLDDIADMPLPGSRTRMSKDRRRRILIIGGAVLFIFVVTFSLIHFLDLWPGKKAAKAPAEPPAATSPQKPEAPKAPAAPEAGKATAPAPAAAPEAPAAKPEESAKVKDITLQNVRQYYVSNEKAGQLFVIEGKAVNNFKTPKEMIKLEANLFDEKGGSLAHQEVLAGNTVSLFQLQVMTRDELKNALSSQVGILTNNTNIATNGEAPFMIVFFDPPEAVKEFGVKVVDAKDPPKQ